MLKVQNFDWNKVPRKIFGLEKFDVREQVAYSQIRLGQALSCCLAFEKHTYRTRPRHQIYSRKIYLVFFRATKQMLGQYHSLGYNLFLPQSFLFIIQYYHWCYEYIVQADVHVVK